MRRVVKVLAGFCLGFLLVVWMASCDTANLLPSQPLASVDPVPLPKLPEWIEQISPTGEADPLAQIRIRFKEPLILVGDLDDENQQKLDLFQVTPAIAGRFRFLTPRMVGFQMDQALPKATRVRVTLRSGLTDLSNHRLDQDLAWTFNTEPIKLLSLPGATLETPPDQEVEPIDIKQALEITSNVELDLANLGEQAALITAGSNQKVALQAALKKDETDGRETEENASPQEQFDPSQRNWIYTLTPAQTLAKATAYRLELASGLRPAKGNLLSEMPFTSKVSTYAPLTFEGLDYTSKPDAGGAYGRFVQGVGELKFNNGISAESAQKALSITPAPKEGVQWLRAYEGERVITLNPWALEPATSYTITISNDLKDKFGQTLDKPATAQYSTGDVAADFWAPADLHIFPSSKNLQLNLSAVNLPEPTYKAAFRAVQPTDLVYNDTAYPTGEGKDLLPPVGSWQNLPVPAQQQNKSTEIPIPLREKLGSETGMLAYGVQARTYQYDEEGKQVWREPNYYGLVQQTNLGVFAQWFPSGGLVRVNHLSDGSAAAGAAVEIYESSLEDKPAGRPTPCAMGTADPTGSLVLTPETMSGCFKGKSGFSEPPKLLAIAREAQDWAFVRTLEWSGDYGYGITTGWNADTPESRGTIFSDRQLYQPSEKGWFTGVAAYLKNGELQLDKNVAYTVTLDDPQGNSVTLGTKNTNKFGTFSIEVPFAANQALGSYTIRAKGTTGTEISGEFRVAEFKPPNFKVDLALDKAIAKMGETVTGQAQSNYLFGPPVQGGAVEYFVTRERAALTPKGWEQFSFGRQWFWPEEEPSVQADVLQNTTTLDEAGKGNQAVTVAQDLPYPMTYRMDAQVTDVSNLSVTSSKTFTALVSDRLIGLKSDFVATAKEPFNVQVIVTNPQGEAISGQGVKLELQRMTYSSVTQLIEGSPTLKDQVEYKTVAQANVRSGNTAQTVQLTPTESGSYRIRANLNNANGEATATDLQIWATGEGEVSWSDRYDNERLELELDKDSYRVGETATVLLQSPYPNAELYFAVVRNNVLYKTLTKVQGSAPRIQFEVTPDMLPNAAVEAVLVRQGAPIEQAEPGSLKDLVRIGFSPFSTSLEEKALKAEVTASKAELQPGQEQTLQLKLQDVKGQPLAGQFTVMVVNEAVRQLTDYRPPNLVDTVFAEQPISTRFGDNRPDVVLQPLTSPLDKGWGYGGGLSAGAGSTRIRTEFKPLAYYNGSVEADATGNATVTFTLPDDLTTWRVMVVATDGQLRFGNGEATFVTSKPLVTNPILPQFARPGDRLEAGLSVTNNTGGSGNLSINGAASGSLQLAQNADASLQTQSAAGTQAYRFPMVVNGANEGKVQFSTELNGNSDAFEFPLEIRPLEVTEQVIETGSTTSKVQIPIKIENTVANDAGGLDITLASTIIPELQEPARQVLEEDPLPFLETAASQLAIAANLQILTQTYGQSFGSYKPTEQATSALERLQNLQRADGGFAAYPRQERSDPFVSSYAAQSLASARNAKLPVNERLVSRAIAYLQKILADPGQYDFCKAQGCKDQVRLEALTALAALGEERSDFLGDLYERRNNFSLLQKIELAQHLSRFPDWQSEASAIASQIQETIYQTGRTATVNLPQDWKWLGSVTAAQSEALRLFIARQAPPETLDRLAKALLDQRRQGTWGSTYDNAQALTALV